MIKDNFTLIMVFFPSYWNDNIPEINIFLDNKHISSIRLEKNLDLSKFEFPIELDYGDHELAVQYTNKNSSDIFWHNGKRLRENFVKLEKVYINFVDLGNLVKTNSKTTVLFDRTEYKLKFRSPIYYWMLHNIKDL